MATQVWPGSHTVYTAHRGDDDPLADETFVEKRREMQPPVRNCFPAGAVVFRDARIWVRVHPLLPPTIASQSMRSINWLFRLTMRVLFNRI
jgi:hypothetical protein|eukprot:COSAG02_NODE_28355_length_591_cov_0.829268_1_plen_91_part_00